MLQLPLNQYTEFLHDIRTTKIAPGFNGNPPKIYKYILVLSLLDFFYDQDTRLSPFNKAVPIDELVIYYKLNLADDLYGNLIENKKVVYGNDKLIKEHIQAMPLRKLCNNSSYFKNNDRNPKSRKIEDFPTQFEICKPSTLDDAILTVLLRNKCNQLIISKTGISTVLNQVQVIKQAEQSTTENTTYTSAVRWGQQQYRQSLLERYNNSCALCSVDFNPMLVASHAKPWRSCQTVHERLTPNNGLLLCSQHDSLFDKGYIAIDVKNNYQLLKSSEITTTVDRQLDSIDHDKLIVNIEQLRKMIKYLDYHLHHIFKG